MKQKIERLILAICFVWFFVNIIVLVLSRQTKIAYLYFYPFIPHSEGHWVSHMLGKVNYYVPPSTTDYTLLQVYDVSEFLVYGVSPLVLLFAYRFVMKKS